MHLTLLSFQPWPRPPVQEEERLLQEAKAQGHEMNYIDAAELSLCLDAHPNELFYQGKPFDLGQAVLVRPYVMREGLTRLSPLKAFEQKKIPHMNRYEAILVSKNKLRTYKALLAAGLPIPKTVMIQEVKSLESAVERVGGAPLILKFPYGTYGKGVILAESLASARSILDAFWVSNYATPFLIQEYIEEAAAADIRLFVLGNQVIASMIRSGVNGEFRANAELGGEQRVFDAPNDLKELAIKAAKALGLDIAGVDLVQSKRGPLILEVNANPGFKALEQVSGVNVAGKVVEHLLRY